MGVLGEILVASLFSMLLSPEPKVEKLAPEEEKIEQAEKKPSEECVTLEQED